MARRTHRAAAIIAAAVLAVAAIAEDIPTFRSEVNLIRVDAQVTDASGRDISNLREQDFTVFDEGEQRQVAHFGRETEPLDVILVLDVSGSMYRYLRDLSTNTATALRQLRPGDRVALLLFASRSELMQAFTTDFNLVEKRLVESIYKQTLGSDTFVNEGLMTAANYVRLNSPANHRRAILIITDNETSIYRHTNTDVQQALSASNTVLNAIVVGPGREQMRSRYANPNAVAPDVDKFAEQSGGQSVTTTRVAEALRGTLAQIRTRYSLQYAGPPAGRAGEYRRIRLDLTPDARRAHPGAIIRAREGYYVTQ